MHGFWQSFFETETCTIRRKVFDGWMDGLIDGRITTTIGVMLMMGLLLEVARGLSVVPADRWKQSREGQLLKCFGVLRPGFMRALCCCLDLKQSGIECKGRGLQNGRIALD